jgi:hypothetical protein
MSLLGYGNPSDGLNRWTLELSDAGNARCSTTSGGNFTGFSSPNSISAGQLAHFCAVWASGTDRRVFLNGVKATNAESCTFATSGTWQWRIGERPLSISAPANGEMSEPAIWAAALDDVEIQDGLANGFAPSYIRPSSLISYPPFVRTNRDLKGIVWTENGTVPVVPHARVFA